MKAGISKTGTSKVGTSKTGTSNIGTSKIETLKLERLNWYIKIGTSKLEQFIRIYLQKFNI